MILYTGCYCKFWVYYFITCSLCVCCWKHRDLVFGFLHGASLFVTESLKRWYFHRYTGELQERRHLLRQYFSIQNSQEPFSERSKVSMEFLTEKDEDQWYQVLDFFICTLAIHKNEGWLSRATSTFTLHSTGKSFVLHVYYENKKSKLIWKNLQVTNRQRTSKDNFDGNKQGLQKDWLVHK